MNVPNLLCLVAGDEDFPRNRLQYLREIGRGWFGRVSIIPMINTLARKLQLQAI